MLRAYCESDMPLICIIDFVKIKIFVTKLSFLRLTYEKKEVSSSGLRKIISFILSASVFLCYDNYKKSVFCRRNNSKHIF